MGSWTKLRKGRTLREVIGPSFSVWPLAPTEVWSVSQMRSSDHVLASSDGSHWKYIRWRVSVRWLIRAKPCGEWL